MPNELAEDPTGDLAVLSNEESFRQSIQNYFDILPGTIPYYEEVGFDPKVSDDVGAQEKPSILQLRIVNVVAGDARIKNTEISDGVKTGINLGFKLTITAVSGSQVAITP